MYINMYIFIYSHEYTQQNVLENRKALTLSTISLLFCSVTRQLFLSLQRKGTGYNGKGPIQCFPHTGFNWACNSSIFTSAKVCPFSIKMDKISVFFVVLCYVPLFSISFSVINTLTTYQTVNPCSQCTL